MLNKKVVLLWTVYGFLFFLMAGCSPISTSAEYTSEQLLMDTLINIKAYGNDEAQVKKAVQDAFAAIKEIERLTDRFAEEGTAEVEMSDVYRINQAAGKQAVKVSDDVYNMIEMAMKYDELTQGSFDVTIGPVMDLWGFGNEEKHVPSDTQLQQKLTLVDNDCIKLNKQNRTVYLPKPGMVIDLGGIAKGYATEKAASVLKSAGIEHAIINAGGNIDVIGEKTDGKAWRIGIQDPRDTQNLVGILSLIDEVAVTSGDYQRYFEKDGTRYHHILSPKTGKPANDTMSVTVITDNSIEADILSTALFVMGPEEGLKFVEQLEGVEAFFIGIDNKITMSSGLKGKVEVQPGKRYIYDQNG